jgi:hypothetical protein
MSRKAFFQSSKTIDRRPRVDGGHKLSGAIKSMASIAATGEVARLRLALQPLNYTMCSARTFSLLMLVRSRGCIVWTSTVQCMHLQKVASSVLLTSQSDHNLNHGRG